MQIIQKPGHLEIFVDHVKGLSSLDLKQRNSIMILWVLKCLQCRREVGGKDTERVGYIALRGNVESVTKVPSR